MNDKVEEIYEQMFAPNPIPDCVRAAFESVNKHASRVDAGLMRPLDLAIIASIGLSGAMPTTVAVAYPPQEHDGLIDTVEGDEEQPVPAPTRFTEPLKDADRTSEPVLTSHGPTGPMDAPSKPVKKGTSKYAMQKMSLHELRVHAREFYGYKPKLSMGKGKLIKALAEREPL